MTEQLSLAGISAEVITNINTNFTQTEDAVNAKAELNGDSTQKFNVADAVEPTEAINKRQLDNYAVGIATLDTSNMPNLANNSVTPNTQIDFSAGLCWDDTLNKRIVSTTMTKKLDVVFTAGSGNGGLDTGAKAINTWYHCFAIAKADGTSDFLFSTSVSAPTLPADYVYKRRIGSIKTDSSGNILKFVQVHDTFLWDTYIEDLHKTSGFLTSYQNLTVSTPIGVITEGLFEICAYFGAEPSGFLIATTLCTNSRNLDVENNDNHIAVSCGSVLVDTSSQIKYYCASTNLNYAYVYCQGYKDFRGIK